MKVVGLVSGGKDSCYAMMKCIEYGHEIVALANLMPIDESVDELDSYMYQTVGHQIVVSYAECMGLPLFRRRIKGSMRYQNLSYKMTPGDEVEDMLILLKEVKKQIPSITAVSSGAIASDYQRLRVESICSRLGLVSLAYLWKQDQSLLLQEMITMGIAAITVKVAALGLDPAKHLGKEISYLQPHLLRLKESYGINVCGEGGEYETLTLDCPLFRNARIVLDEFQIILHSLDSIAPVGVLHPSAYHLEFKREHTSFSDSKRTNTCLEKVGSVCEVEGDSVPECEPKFLSTDSVSEFGEIAEIRLHISKSKRDDTFSIGCWIEGSSRTSEGLQKDLTAVLHRIESQFAVDGFGWMNVLYIHLYIANMNEFSLANETYVRFITEEKCRIGVPSRSTIELPLAEVGLGRAYIEVLVAKDIKKKVLHVQSISSWAPSCIGPYSQATLHNEILHMAGQLGLDPPTMTLCNGGPTAELEQALNNCEAVAECFNCSIAYSAIILIIYCSASIVSDQRINIQERLETFLRERKLDELDYGSVSKVSNSIILYILVPDLPKRALVEIKPVLYAQEDKETRLHTDLQGPSCFTSPNYWGFQHSCWHESCYRKCIVHGKICAVILCITNELVTKICSDSLDCQYSAKEKDMQRITRFCLYLIDKVFLEDSFSWEDITNMRFYFPTSLCMSADMLSLTIADAFAEFAKVSQRISVSDVPVFNVVPVLGAGQSVTSMDDVITCEVFAVKP